MGRREIVEGRVTVDGAPALKPARMVSPSENIELLGPPAKFVSRAGRKLEGALEQFGVGVSGLVCLDAGSSTGGFTDCLLQHGADHVFAVDVGTNQLHEKIRANPAVTVHEQTDIRSVDRSFFDRDIQLVVGDLSFISLRLVLPTLAGLLDTGTPLILLIKPQFEAGKQEASKSRGVITDPAIWTRTVTEVLDDASRLGMEVAGLGVSPISGRTGNVEFVAHLSLTGVTDLRYSQDRLEDVVAEAEARLRENQ